ncbi:ribosomal-protein-alanine N-acetyltransferase [Thioclava sp. SK-1]|uniref:ribosomal protein S18-alanine N-acetyltransferase n=1 Tax=Thioclava sp. SK-1 TaxID=1889770 RepID=UPI00082582F0|nr:ribosomal protein S18-alanine N-acetyltransferase [Thioclava sp. SK-1]OCX64662.1 ribosomal-protein-alanine N-acetyltransferase [Thioclava sp. SK-1]
MTPDQLAALHAQCFTVPRPWSAGEFRTTLADRFSFIVFHTDGFALGRAVAGEAELITIAVDPTARRRGAGRALISQFVAVSTERDAQTAFLEVVEDNAAAIALYDATGWHETGRRKGYYRRPDGRRQDALIMARDITPYF